MSLIRQSQYWSLMALRRAIAWSGVAPLCEGTGAHDRILGRWWRGKANWGDSVNPILMQSIANRPVAHAGWNLRGETVYSVVGSVLDVAAEPCLEVWGSGFMHSQAHMICQPQRVHAVRGKLTRDRLVALGVGCPQIFGDPGLLFASRFGYKARPTGKLAIVPHFADRNSESVRRVASQYDLAVINIQADVEQVVANIAECEWIASSSLHGLVIADSLGIPNTWIQVSRKVMGEGFKFLDYFSGVDRPIIEPLLVTSETRLDDMRRREHSSPIRFFEDDLMGACPFLPGQSGVDAIA